MTIKISSPISILGELSTNDTDSQSSFTSAGHSKAAEFVGLETVVVTLCVEAATVTVGALSDWKRTVVESVIDRICPKHFKVHAM